jgi:hypothetical protein
MRHFVHLPSVRDIFLTHRRAVRCLARAQVLLEIQSFPCRLHSLGLTHSVTRWLNVFVCSVSSPWDSLRGKRCQSHRYDLSRHALPPQKVATTAQWSKPFPPEPLCDVLIPQEIIRLQIAPFPPPPHAEGQARPSPLLAATSREKIAGEIGGVDLLQQVNNSIRPFVGGVLKPNVEIPNNEGGAVCGAPLPCHSEIVHPRHTVGGDVDPHDVVPLVARNKLEGHQVRGQGPYRLDLESIVVLPPDEAYYSWCGLVAFDTSTLYPKRDFEYRSLVTFVLVRNPIPTPICANPLAAAAIPVLLPQQMLHIAMEKGLVPLVPLPPGQGGVNAVDIIVINLIGNKINSHQKYQQLNPPS